MTQSNAAPRRAPWPDYRAVWRWHFYAGILCIPFVVVLALTGAIYLFRTEIEAALDAPYDRLATAAAPLPPQAQVAAALAWAPGSVLKSYELPRGPDAAARVLVSQGAEVTRVYVDPANGRVLKAVAEDDRLMRVLFRLHGELLMGDRGSYVVELAACWTIVMVLTGLFLWWPRQANGLRGVLIPRFDAGSKLGWRDAHAVTGIWISLMVLVLLATGLPWAKNWGGYLKDIRALTGTSVSRQDWTTGRASEMAERRADDAGARAALAADHAGHDMAGMEGMSGMEGMNGMAGMPAMAGGYAPLDRITATVAALNLPPPVLISPPTRPGGNWTAKSDAPNRPLRVDLTLSDDGAVLRRTDFNQRHWIDQVVGYGVALHEGRLFGWANQALGLITVLGLLTLSASAVVLWWRRKPADSLGAPEPLADPRWAWGLAAAILALGVYLPLFGASLVAVLLLDATLLRAAPGLRRWLGLGAAREAAP